MEITQNKQCPLVYLAGGKELPHRKRTNRKNAKQSHQSFTCVLKKSTKPLPVKYVVGPVDDIFIICSTKGWKQSAEVRKVYGIIQHHLRLHDTKC